MAFSVGEELKYNAYYNLGKIWIKAGEASFSVDEKDGNYLFSGGTQNLPGWDWLYLLRTTHEASMTKQFQPLYLKVITIENKKRTDEKYIYNGNTVHKHLVSNDYPQGKDTVYTVRPCSWDIINVVYIVRNLNLKNAKQGETIPLFVNLEDSTNTIYGKVLGKETIKNREGKVFNCLKFSASVIYRTIILADKPVNVWITDDDFRIPVLIEFKVAVGYVKVFLHSYKIQNS